MIIWKGKSGYQGGRAKRLPIQAILTGANWDNPTRNPKTGPMATLWILAQNVSPKRAQETSADQAVCGDCPLRPAAFKDRALAKLASLGRCYVRTEQGPLSTWKAHQGEPVRDLEPEQREHVKRNGLRFGGYGDPVFLPARLVQELAKLVGRNNWTGYTQRWARKSSQWAKRYLMASCQDLDSAQYAHKLGWRVFYTRPRGAALPRGFTQCPAAVEAGRRSTCQQCGLCDGSSSAQDKRPSISIEQH